MIYLDTNCLLRYVLGDNPEQLSKVLAIIEKERGVRVSTEAFCEFVWVLESFYQMNRGQVADRLTLFLDHAGIGCERDLLRGVTGVYIKHPKVSFVDILLVARAERGGGKLATFDKAMARKLPDSVKLLAG